MISLLPLPLIILGAILVALVLGMRIGYAFARKQNTRETLQHAVLSDEYQTLYEDMCYADSLLHNIYGALMKQNPEAICQFVEDYQEWNGINDLKAEEPKE